MALAVFLAALLLLIGLFALNNRRVTRLRFMYFPASFGSKFSKIQPFYSHYTKLSPEHKREFDWRAFYFLYTTNIEFRQFDGFPDADKTRLPHLLASVAAQMTFFLPEDCFRMIHTILVYPKIYFSPLSNQYHKGETNPRAGIIVLSLPGIAEGIEISDDGINLIIHEYAHALWLEHKLTNYEIFEEEAAERFQQAASRELQVAAAAESHFFREYGLTNLHEFIAVAAENFFERPHEFRMKLPHIFETMVALYKQDPGRF